MHAVRIVSTATDDLVAGFHRCLDRVARERRYLGLVQAMPLDVTAAFVREVLADGGVHLVALDSSDEVVGWCDVARHRREGFRHVGRMGMGLLPEVRGQGLGERLLRAALEQARTLGMERVELDVFASNARARALYHRLGFTVEGVRRRARKLDGAYDDDILMALPLDARDAGAMDHPSDAEPALFLVTGASGAGKTTLVRMLAERALAGVRCHHFDEIGVPSSDEMDARFGGPDAWQAWATREWIARLTHDRDGVAVHVLDGQLRPSAALAEFRAAGLTRTRVLLVDCDHGERHLRLTGPRGQPELASPRMDAWAAYLRGQADALHLPVLDTTGRSPEESLEILVATVRALGAPHG